MAQCRRLANNGLPLGMVAPQIFFGQAELTGDRFSQVRDGVLLAICQRMQCGRHERLVVRDCHVVVHTSMWQRAPESRGSSL